MDVLIWFKKYTDENTDKEKNKTYWDTTTLITQSGQWIRGEIIRIADNGWGTFQPVDGSKTLSVLPFKVTALQLYPQQILEVTTKQDPTGTKTLIENIRVI